MKDGGGQLNHDLADAAARVLRRLHATAGGDVPATSAARQNEMTERVRFALERRSGSSVRRRQVTRVAALAAGIAVASTAAVVSWRRANSVGPHSVGPLVVLRAPAADGNGLALGMTLAVGARVSAPTNSEVGMGTPDGSSLALEKGGALTIVDQSATRRYALVEGAVRARVAKLAAHERFLITTSDAEVEVHGTSFRVATVAADPNCGAGIRTRVSVDEGVVTVRARGVETRLPAGAEWPANCAVALVVPPVAAPAPKPVAAAEPAPVSRRVVPARSRGATRSNAPVTSAPVPVPAAATTTAGSALAAANDLLSAAIHARRQERPLEAERLLRELIERYPNGPLLETAMAQRMRMLGPIDRSAAATAANNYLMRFPRGYARDEARRLAGAEP